jgi:hypothetical protein
LFDPIPDRLYLLSTQAPLILELSISWFRQPGRHVTALCDIGDLAGVRFYIAIREE